MTPIILKWGSRWPPISSSCGKPWYCDKYSEEYSKETTKCTRKNNKNSCFNCHGKCHMSGSCMIGRTSCSAHAGVASTLLVLTISQLLWSVLAASSTIWWSLMRRDLLCVCVTVSLYYPGLSMHTVCASLTHYNQKSSPSSLSCAWKWPSKFSPDVILCGWLGLKHQLTN